MKHFLLLPRNLNHRREFKALQVSVSDTNVNVKHQVGTAPCRMTVDLFVHSIRLFAPVLYRSREFGESEKKFFFPSARHVFQPR